MTNDHFYAPGHKPAKPREPEPGQALFEFARESDYAHFRCELQTNERPGGFEVQFFMEGELIIGQRFGSRDWALEWAAVERKHFEKGGA